MSGVEVAVLSLAAFRIWRFIAVDDFPPMARLRDKLIARWKDSGDEDWWTGITCRWCLGTVIGSALVAGYSQVVSVRLPAIYGAAVCALMGLIGKLDQGD